MAHDFIRVEGARTHNLKNISLSIPHHKITVLTGPSGSGKSSLAFHTLYAEGQRRYVETFSPYTRQFLDRMPKPDVDRIEGIPPAIAIEQANAVKTSRSTVGTMTEIADYLKLLFPRLAVLYSDDGQQKIHPYTPREAWDELCKAWPERDCIVVFEVKFPRHTPLSEALSFVQTQGFTRVWLDHAVVRIEELLQDASNLNTTLHTLPVVLDRLRVAAENTSRAVEAIEMAYHYGQETVIFLSYDATSRRVGAEKRFTSQWRDPYTGKSYRAPTPEQFTFNHPIGACPRCHGFGRVIEIDYNLALPDRSLSIRQGVVKPFRGEQGAEWQRELLRFCQAHRIDVDAPFNSLPQEVQNLILFGQTDSHTGSSHAQPKSMPSWPGVAGYFRWLETKTYKMHVRVLLSRYRAYLTCPECKGDRFARETLQYKLNHPTTPLTIAEINALPLHQALHYFETLSHTALDEVSLRLTQEIITRLRYLNHIGLGYLHLNRASRTLSGGEIQRVNLTVCLGNSLVNTLFVLDEPTIGLHPHDNDRLISAMRLLRDRGNTLLVVEHDEMVITSADHLIEIGPGSGLEGGQIVAQGTPSEILADPRTLTAQWLRSDRAPTPLSTTTDAPPSDYIRILQAHANNLKHINVDIPLARFVAVTGVSGSGKSTLIHEVLVKNINRVRSGISQAYEGCEALHGAEKIQDLIIVDQSPLTKTPRSNPVIYSGAYEAIRQLFASTDEAIRRGLDASSFSFNSDSGRCPHCQGAGYERVTMQFLADVWIQCPVCNGRRFQNHILQVEYRGRTIDQILDFTVDQAIDFFSKTIRTPLSSHHSNPQSLPRERLLRQKIVQALTALAEVGLGYLKLGQPLNQLSGGEAQRLKLMSHMSGITSPQDDSSESDEDEITENSQPSNSEALDSRSTDHNSLSQARHKLLILDEPTTGLHFREVQLLIQVLRKLVNQGYSLIVIEHQLDLIQSADWIIDLGPGAGEHGGEIVACGTPYDIANHPQSLTGRYLSQRLNKKPSPITLTAPIQLENHINKEPSNSAARKAIILRGAREHNLKNINTQFELGKFHVITGLSGSGKSTLAFDILFAEGQRRYLDSLNVYARQFVEQLSKPDVDQITGLPPSVAIEQRRSRGGAKSTVATVTEIYHFLRLLYAKLGVPHDPDNGEPAQKINPDALVEKILSEIKKKKELTILAPIIKSRKGYHADVAQWAMRNQYPYLRIDGKWIKPTHFKKLDRYVEHTIDVVLGNVSSKKTRIENEKCLREGLLIGNGTIYTLDNQKNETIYSRHWYCPTSGRSFDEPDPRWFSFNSPHGWCPTCEGHGVIGAEELEREIQGEEIRHELVQTCPTCSGERLNAIARAVRLPYGKWGQRERTSLRKGKQKTQESCGPRLPELMRLPLTELQAYLQTISLKGRDARIAADLLKEIHQRLNFLCEVGLDYLTLDRPIYALSGGEAQRITLAAQLGSNLQGVLYVLDEPTIGLHARDNERLIATLLNLRDRGNTLVVVEHDEEVMKSADRILDLGPGAGKQGGSIVADGTWDVVAKVSESATGRHLAQPLSHPLLGKRREVNKKSHWLNLSHVHKHNLHDFSVSLPLQRLVVLCGVSGSGKSTLLLDVLKPLLESIYKAGRKPDPFLGKLESSLPITRVVEVDQSPLGRTSRSTPATYLGLLDAIRELFASTPAARERGYGASRFSYNTAGGRCEHCAGQGQVKVEMQFLPTFYLPCESCRGKRYNSETLSIYYKGKTVADVLEMSAQEASEFFVGIPDLRLTLNLMVEIGLDYIALGQPSNTLSGGEAQRLRLVAELAESLRIAQKEEMRKIAKERPHHVYLLEEPTIGLHGEDVRRLILLLHRLVDQGHSVWVIEHHLDLIAEADWLIELGPGPGEKGGRVVFEGTPEELIDCRFSPTAPYLKPYICQQSRSGRLKDAVKSV